MRPPPLYFGSVAPTMVLLSRNISSQSVRGILNMWEMTASGIRAATSVAKSYSSRQATTSSTFPVISSTLGASRRRARGVKRSAATAR